MPPPKGGRAPEAGPQCGIKAEFYRYEATQGVREAK